MTEAIRLEEGAGIITLAPCFTTDKDVRIVMEHQADHNVKDIHLQVYTESSPWHVFARLYIRRL